MNIIGKKIKELREEKELSQKMLGKELNLSQATIARWETGVRTPDIYSVVILADFFDVTADYLLGRED